MLFELVEVVSVVVIVGMVVVVMVNATTFVAVDPFDAMDGDCTVITRPEES